MNSTEPSVYDQIGPDAFERLIDAFYRRVATDPVLRPMYPEEDLTAAARRLRLFLIQLFGGPSTYSDERGHPRLRARHLPFRIDQAARDVWMRHMQAALDEAAIADPARSAMLAYFERAATGMINSYHPE
ncbi:MAG TPA: globin [Aggregatilinea sp.]|uniref:globin n=1 Tax=Aggregatilinea sp. TaxID=2806333 RepID=UPI002CD9B42D|nr:globin [Aggregatilinea sp.]HML22248.1 globin [Aggregatilinea sp.]